MRPKIKVSPSSNKQRCFYAFSLLFFGYLNFAKAIPSDAFSEENSHMVNTLTYFLIVLIILLVAMITLLRNRLRNAKKKRELEKLLEDLRSNSADLSKIRVVHSASIYKSKSTIFQDGSSDITIMNRFRNLKSKGRFSFHLFKKIGEGEYLFVVDTVINDFVVNGLGGNAPFDPTGGINSVLELRQADLAASGPEGTTMLKPKSGNKFLSSTWDMKKFDYYLFILRANPAKETIELFSDLFDTNTKKSVQRDFMSIIQTQLK